MYGALLLFESEFVHIVAISFTSLILTELLMVALTIQTWHWLMIVGELLSLACYVASLVFLHEFIGERDRQKKKTHMERFAANGVPGRDVGVQSCWFPAGHRGSRVYCRRRCVGRKQMCIFIFSLRI